MLSRISIASLRARRFAQEVAVALFLRAPALDELADLAPDDGGGLQQLLVQTQDLTPEELEDAEDTPSRTGKAMAPRRPSPANTRNRGSSLQGILHPQALRPSSDPAQEPLAAREAPPGTAGQGGRAERWPRSSPRAARLPSSTVQKTPASHPRCSPIIRKISEAASSGLQVWLRTRLTASTPSGGATDNHQVRERVVGGVDNTFP